MASAEFVYMVLNEQNIAHAYSGYVGRNLNNPPANYIPVADGTDPDSLLGREYDPETETWGDPPPPPTHRLQMTDAEFNSLFTPKEYRKIKRLRQQETDDGEIVDQMFDFAVMQGTVDITQPTWAGGGPDSLEGVSAILVRTNCVTQPRMDEINKGYPI